MGHGKIESNLPQTYDYLWLLSCGEIWSDGYESGATTGLATQKEGEQYAYYKNVTKDEEGNIISCKSRNSQIIKSVNEETSSIYNWWLRSQHYNSWASFCTVTSNGSSSYANANQPEWIAPGFCI